MADKIVNGITATTGKAMITLGMFAVLPATPLVAAQTVGLTVNWRGALVLGLALGLVLVLAAILGGGLITLLDIQLRGPNAMLVAVPIVALTAVLAIMLVNGLDVVITGLMSRVLGGGLAGGLIFVLLAIFGLVVGVVVLVGGLLGGLAGGLLAAWLGRRT